MGVSKLIKIGKKKRRFMVAKLVLYPSLFPFLFLYLIVYTITDSQKNLKTIQENYRVKRKGHYNLKTYHFTIKIMQNIELPFSLPMPDQV